MTCKEITELVTDYLERRLSLRDRLRVRWHLGFCRFCRAYLRQMRTTIRITGRLPDEPPPRGSRCRARSRRSCCAGSATSNAEAPALARALGVRGAPAAPPCL